jgi:hypothetical protein
MSVPSLFGGFVSAMLITCAAGLNLSAEQAVI